MRLLLSLVLTFSLTISLAEEFFPAEHCVAETQETDLNQMTVSRSNSYPKDLKDSHNHDCSCPVHGPGCVHTNTVAIAPEGKLFDHLTQNEVSKMAYTDRDQMKKNGPYLDEPFQPPRV
ncbi:MAG: hypothetical protein J0L82_12705 [Deltaproteobacteria bacterium]|jgi:hypothetical protein|nr:hypothetical protein [Deltaproteobacteria bacterium]